MTPDICPNCGAEVPAGARACPECGADEETAGGGSPPQRPRLPDEEFDYDDFTKREFGKARPGAARTTLVLVAWSPSASLAASRSFPAMSDRSWPDRIIKIFSRSLPKMILFFSALQSPNSLATCEKFPTATERGHSCPQQRPVRGTAPEFRAPSELRALLRTGMSALRFGSGLSALRLLRLFAAIYQA